jgi:tetratricopeptide (TPR) repeat protein
MMRSIIVAIMFFFGLQSVNAQTSKYDSLKNLLATAKDDSTKFIRLDDLFSAYVWSYPDSSLTYVQQQILLANQMKSDIDLLAAYNNYSWFYILIGDYVQAVQTIHQMLKLAEESKNFIPVAQAKFLLAVVYEDEGNQEEAISNIKAAKSIMESHWKPSFNMIARHLEKIGNSILL